MKRWSSCAVVLAACVPAMTPDTPVRVDRSLALSTPKAVSDGRAEPEPETPFRDDDARCRRGRERAFEACRDHPDELGCFGFTLETFWDPLARACRLMPLAAYSGAGCMSGGGGGLSIRLRPEGVGLACSTGTVWNGCACECARGDWDPAVRRCAAPTQ